MNSANLKEIILMGKGDILFLYTDGVYDGSDEGEKKEIEQILEQQKQTAAKTICNTILERAVRNDDRLRQSDETDHIDDKTVFIIKKR